MHFIIYMGSTQRPNHGVIRCKLGVFRHCLVIELWLKCGYDSNYTEYRQQVNKVKSSKSSKFGGKQTFVLDFQITFHSDLL